MNIDCGDPETGPMPAQANSARAPMSFTTDRTEWLTWPVKHVRLRLQVCEYCKTLNVQIVSDAAEMGFHAMENGIGEAYQHLPSRDVPADPDNPAAGTERVAFVELTDAEGNRRIVEDIHLRGEEWLKDLVVGIEIVNRSET